ncbi:MAG: glutathione S-transferase family protein [Alphaproteobacteria bacterium]|nr:glutathione S-transferase family protein [Alphaproteobacteria bacterium]
MTEAPDIEITAYDWVPDMARGKVKDLRVRWALNEIGLPYRERLVGNAGSEKSTDHLADQPFGQVPVYKEGGLTLFESGAILLHIGEKDERLLPRDRVARARATAWMFAALNSVEPFLQALFLVDLRGSGQAWHSPAKENLRPFAENRLRQLSAVLGEREWLEDRFTLGDLLMIDILRTSSQQDLVHAHANLSAYVERGTARPAFQSAVTAQLAAFERGEPK